MLKLLASLFSKKPAAAAPQVEEVKAEAPAVIKPKKKPAVKKAASGEKKPRAKKTK